MRETTATIDLDAIRCNLAKVRAAAPASKVMAVVKADGYGHGLERVAQVLREADAFGVASIEDAARVRDQEQANGWAPKRIVLLSGIDAASDLRQLRELRLDSVIHDVEQLNLLAHDRGPRRHRLWLKLDTGMHRLGFACDQAPALLERVRNLPTVDPQPLWMTHFASADVPDSALNDEQQQRFNEAIAGLPGERSLANSAAILSQPAAHADWVRPGGLLYGLSSFDDRTGPQLGFEPAMTLSSRLIAVKTVAAGETIGYGESFRCEREMRIGIASIGYGDGYPRHASGHDAQVLVDGMRARVVGRISMDLSCIDLSTVPEAHIGSEVTLWGPEIPAELIARTADTISYELTCGITRRVRVIELGAQLSGPVQAKRIA